MSNSAEGTLTKASSSAHAAVNSIAGAAEEVTRKAKPAIDRVNQYGLAGFLAYEQIGIGAG